MVLLYLLSTADNLTGRAYDTAFKLRPGAGLISSFFRAFGHISPLPKGGNNLY
jgi:hypothetical protein